MSKYITVKLTEDQAYSVIQAMEWWQNPDYPMSDKHNAFGQRIINKLVKALAQAKN